ncbi:MAG: HisA/HisF-related TIM barrel protein, partial [Alphaproteobacteria bacterium]
VKGSNIQATELVKHYEDAGVTAVIYTDIARDGTGEGVNIAATTALADATNIPVIASGGIGSLSDIKAVKAASESHGLNGVIVGKALYDERVDPHEALVVAAG